MRRGQRLLLIAFAISLLVHAIVAIVLHPPRADIQNQAEVVSIERRSVVIAVRKPPTPPPRPAATTKPRVVALARPPARNGNAAPSAGGTRGRAATPPPTPPPPPPSPSGNGCAAPKAPAALLATPPPPEIPPEVRAEDTSGVASIRVDLDASAQILGTSVTQSTGNSGLDLVAVAMARDARYSAEVRACKPVAGSYTFSVKFVGW